MRADANLPGCTDHIRFQVSLTRLTRALEFASADVDYHPDRDVDSIVRAVLAQEPYTGGFGPASAA